MIEHEALNAHSQKSGMARGVHRGRIIRIKMAARAQKRVSKGFYKDLSNVSTADYLNDRTSASKGPFYEIERVLSQRTMRGKVDFSLLVHSYGIILLYLFVALLALLDIELKLFLATVLPFRTSIFSDGCALTDSWEIEENLYLLPLNTDHKFGELIVRLQT